MSPDPWQQIVLDDWLAERGGRWSSLTCGLSMPRQNGKNAVVEMREIFGIVGRGEKVLHTAHEVKTARKAFKRLLYFFGTKRDDPGAQFPELNALVADVRNVNGQEAVYLKNGGSVEVVARSKNSARGFTVDVLVMDEAQEMSDDDLEALMPTTSAAPLGNPQWIFTGTPPGPAAQGEIFTRVRDEALGGKSLRLAWHEWSAEPGVDLDDRDAWRMVNPALINGRLQFEVIEGERARFSDEGFGRERLGLWASATASRVIPAQSWDLAGDDRSVAVDRFALGVEVGKDQESASVVLAGQRPDGAWHVELDDQRQGAAWLPTYIEALVLANPKIRAVVCDVGGPVAALCEQRAGGWWLKGSKVRVTPMTVKDLAAACSQFLVGIVDGSVRHTRQPQVGVAASVATKRALQDSGMWVWSRRSVTSDITPVQAATLALWGAQTSTARRPSRNATGRKVVTF